MHSTLHVMHSTLHLMHSTLDVMYSTLHVMQGKRYLAKSRGVQSPFGDLGPFHLNFEAIPVVINLFLARNGAPEGCNGKFIPSLRLAGPHVGRPQHVEVVRQTCPDLSVPTRQALEHGVPSFERKHGMVLERTTTTDEFHQVEKYVAHNRIPLKRQQHLKALILMHFALYVMHHTQCCDLPPGWRGHQRALSAVCPTILWCASYFEGVPRGRRGR
jgi:hypothetical protein